MADIAEIINLAIGLLTLAIIARSLISWFDPGMRSQVSRILVDITEPVIGPVRQVVPTIGGMIDISPIVTIILLQIIGRILTSALTA
jgi:YggT family protein